MKKILLAVAISSLSLSSHAEAVLRAQYCLGVLSAREDIQIEAALKEPGAASRTKLRDWIIDHSHDEAELTAYLATTPTPEFLTIIDMASSWREAAAKNARDDIALINKTCEAEQACGSDRDAALKRVAHCDDLSWLK